MQGLGARQAEVLVNLARTVLSMADKCSAGPWSVEETDPKFSQRSRRMLVVTPEPWRRRPPVTMGLDWEEHSDVAEIRGGMSAEAKSNAHFIALARDAVPALARFVLRALALLEAEGFIEPAADVAPDLPPPPDLATMQSLTAIWDFYVHVADAMDWLFEAAGGALAGFAVSDRNADWHERLLSGGDNSRAHRAELFRCLADVIDPINDIRRLEALPASSRIRAKGWPKRQDFHDAIPELIRMGLRAEPTIGTDAEVNKEIYGSETPTPDQREAVRQKIAQAKAKRAAAESAAK